MGTTVSAEHAASIPKDNPKDGGSTFHLTVGTYLQVYMVSQPRRL